MNQTRQNTRSRQSQITIKNDKSQADEAVYLVIHSIIDKIYTDKTVFSPITSSRGFKYTMIMYHYKLNAILAKPIKSRHDSDMIKAYKTSSTN